MKNLLYRVSRTIKEVAGELSLPLTDDKEERLILCNKTGHRGRRGLAVKVNWLGVILYKHLDLGQHW